MGKILLGVDIGGGSIRVAAYNTESKSYSVTKLKLPDKAIFPIGEFGYGMDAAEIFSSFISAVEKCFNKEKITGTDVLAISISTLRHTLVALDKDGAVLYASANRDARAVDQTMRLNDTIADKIYNIAGHKPMPNLMACKLMWLRDTQKPLYDKIATAFTIHDYLVYKLTGKIFAERTHAGESMLYDLKRNSWSDELITATGLDKKYFPSFVSAGDAVGAITDKEFSEKLGLKGVKVVAGAGDTQSALLGLSAVKTGDIGIAAGTTAPVQMQADKPLIDGKGRLWTGVSALNGKYYIESNAGGTGMALEWFAGMLFSENPSPVTALMAAAKKTAAGAGGVISTIGAGVFNNSVLSLPIDQLLFSTTNYKPTVKDRYKAARAAVEGVAYAFKANIDQLEEVGGKASEIYLGGGIAKDGALAEILADVTAEKICVPSSTESSALGAVITAAFGTGLYDSLEKAAYAVAKTDKIYDNNTGAYERLFEEWFEMYKTSSDNNMQLGALINELRQQENASDAPEKDGESVKLRIYADADLSLESINMLREYGEVTHKNYRDGDMLEGDDMIETLKDYDIFITEVDIVDAEIVRNLPNLRMVGVCRGNPTNIDIDACTAAGIPVVYVPGRNSDAVADMTLALMLSIIRMVPQSSAFLKEEGQAGDMGRQGAAYFRYQGAELWRKKVGIIGGGAIGRKVAKRLLGFDAELLVYDPYLTAEDAALIGAEKVDYDTLLKKSDIITVHAPVTDETKNMVNAEAFAKMKDGVYFINTARAALVDYDALLKALNGGKVRGAGLDVFPDEPPASNDPLVVHENVLATPHIAGNSVQVSIHQGMIMAENIGLLLKGEMSSDVINRKKLKSFSFSGEKVVNNEALDALKGKALGVSDLDKDKQKSEPKAEIPVASSVAPTAAAKPAVGGYMGLIEVFLNSLSSDAEVKEKTKNKDISFQITFKDNEESCYMYFKEGEVITGLGLFPGAAEVNLKMPIEVFDGMMKGTVNGAKAAMTGKMTFTGNVRKAMSMQSILKLMMGAYEKALTVYGSVDVKALSAEPAQKAAVSASATQGSGGGYAKYMNLIKEFLDNLSKDAEVKEKTKSKDISFQITFKDNEESCYMYFKAGEVITGLGLYPGAAEVNLKMPIAVFDGMMNGTVNGAKAAMTGQMTFTGNVRKAMSMQSILKLMMASYTVATKKVGGIDIASLGEAAAAAAPVSAGTAVKTVATVSAPEPKKKGLLSKLFGKKTVEPSVIVQEKIIYAGGESAKPKTGDVRDEILQVTNELYAKGLLTGIGGNISARCEDNPNHVWITPSSIFKGDLRADMMVRVDLDGNTVSGEFSASSEKMVHLAIYKRRPEIMSVVHSHAEKATLMALTGLKFQPISSDAAFVGDIPVVPFVIPGSPELGDMVGEAIGAEGSAVLMQNHGLVVAGNSPRRAADTTEVVELTAEKLLECKMLGIEPILIPDDACEELASVGKMLV